MMTPENTESSAAQSTLDHADPSITAEELATFREAFRPRLADPEAVHALQHLAEHAWRNPGTGGSEAIADMLRSLYNGEEHRCDLSNVMRLDPEHRKLFSLVIANIGYDPLWDYTIREAFRHVGGQSAVDWFHAIGQD